ncbi:MAG: MATE family efflux transporter [Lachnospiraceae bacterium]|nr:MATE family efflux transporter [Lachnospiraceae bacterium]
MVKNSDFIIKKVFLGTLSIMILSALTAMLGMLIDGMIIRKGLGAEAMAAYGIASPVFVLLSAVSGIFSSGTQTICARSLGKGEREQANKYFSATIITIVLLSVILVPVFLVSGSLVAPLLGASGDDRNLAPFVAEYIKGLSLGIPFLCFTSLFTSLLHLEGRKNLAFIATVVSSIVNVAGDLMCVYVWKGGMFGMALATTFSYVVSTIVMLSFYLKRKSTIKFVPKAIELSAIREVITVGLPSALSKACMMLRTVVINWLILTISTQAASSAFAIRSNLNNLYGAAGIGIGMSTLVIGGVVVGEGSRKDTKELLKTSIKYGFMINAIICVIIILFAKQLVGVYTSDPNEAELAVRALYFTALTLPLAAVNLVFMNYFQAIKKMKLTHLVCLLDNFVYACLAAVVLGFSFNITGIWAAFLVGEILMLITIFILAWKHTGHIPKCMDDLMFLPENFDVPQENRMEFSCQDMTGVTEASKAAYDFVLLRSGNKRKAMLVSLSIEELAGNVIRWGFESDKKNVVDIRLIYREQFVLRIRDNCKPFNPKKWLEMYHLSESDRISNYGIRMTFQMLEDIQYMSTLNLNNLLIKL